MHQIVREVEEVNRDGLYGLWIWGPGMLHRISIHTHNETGRELRLSVEVLQHFAVALPARRTRCHVSVDRTFERGRFGSASRTGFGHCLSARYTRPNG